MFRRFISHFVVPLPRPLPTPLAMPLALGIPLPRVDPRAGVWPPIPLPLDGFGVPNLDEAFDDTGGCSTKLVSVVLFFS
jgi:hypothetical protein